MNPAHLWIGTKHDNVADKVAKGRQARGERIGNAKLQGQQDADEIRRLYAVGGITQEVLGQQFGVHPSTVSRILSGETWAA